jgi:hypothetical protein
MIEKYVSRIKPLRMKGVVRYGLIQVVVPKEYIDRPAFVVVYVMQERPFQRTPLVRVI